MECPACGNHVTANLLTRLLIHILNDQNHLVLFRHQNQAASQKFNVHVEFKFANLIL